MMTNILLWTLFIPSWLLVLPLNKRRVRHFLSVAFFVLALTSIHWQAAAIYKWWIIKENLPFLSVISAFFYGFLPVTTIYVFYFTYPNPWLFFGANLALDAIQAFVVSPLLFEKFGLYDMGTFNHWGLFLIIFSSAPIIYLYQRLYDRKSDYGKDRKAGLPH